MATSNVVVIGAGYAGVRAANRIARAHVPGVTVTVVNPRAEFVERIRLHQHAAGTGTATRPLREVLHPDVSLRTASVAEIGAETVDLDDGTAQAFDRLAYAVGSSAPTVENAHTVSGVAGAQRLRARLRDLVAGDRVVVAGAGLTGIETAAEIASNRPDLTVDLISDTVAASTTPAGERAVLRELAALDVRTRVGETVAGVGPGHVELGDGTVVSSACTIHAGGFTVPDLARRSGLPVDTDGRLRTDGRLVCVGDDRIVGVGDAVAAGGDGFRMSCQAAIPMGRHGGDVVVAALTGGRCGRLSLRFVGQALSIGRRSGVIQPARFDDTPAGRPITGRPAALVKELICRRTIRQLRPGADRERESQNV